MYTEQQLYQRALIEREEFAALYDAWPWPDYPVTTQERWLPLVSAGPTRLIVSRPENTANRRLPALIHFHGGGFIRGRADYDERFCRRLVHDVGCVCINVNYHLAPEHRFPTQPEECAAVVQWVLTHGAEFGIDETRTAVAGHSAGGNLATVACLMALYSGGKLPCCQIIDYGPMSLAGPPPFEGFGPDLSLPATQRAAYFNTCYLNTPEELADWRVSPLQAPSLTGMPPALVLTAELDPLRPDAQRYAQRLAAAGCPVRSECFPACHHGFTVMPNLGPAEQVERAWALMCSYLSQQFQ